MAEALECFLSGDAETGKAVLRDYINATIGFEALGEETGRPPKSLMRMLGPRGNPQGKSVKAFVSRSVWPGSQGAKVVRVRPDQRPMADLLRVAEGFTRLDQG